MAGGLGGIGTSLSTKRLSASLSRFQPKIADNIKTRNVLLDYFMEEDRKSIYNGGTEVAIKFRYKLMSKLGGNQHVNAFNYYDQLTTQPSDTIKTGAEPWSNIQVPISISHEEKIENSGKKEFDLFKDGTEEAMDNLAENMNDVLWGVSGQASIVPTPITTIVSGNDAGTIAGLAKASNTWLYSQETNSIGDAATNALDKMTEAYNLCVDNAPNKSDKLDLFVTDRLVYQAIQGVLPAYVEYNTNKNVDIGFPSVVYMGVRVVFDSTCPLDASGTRQMFGLMGKYWEMALDKTWNFHTTEFFNMMPDQAADIAQLIVRWAVICNQPRTNWRGDGITVS